jgi:hypothetical protein
VRGSRSSTDRNGTRHQLLGATIRVHIYDPIFIRTHSKQAYSKPQRSFSPTPALQQGMQTAARSAMSLVNLTKAASPWLPVTPGSTSHPFPAAISGGGSDGNRLKWPGCPPSAARSGP